MQTTIDVLIVEDDPMVLELHRQYIAKIKGYKLVGCARSGEEGLDMVLSLKPKLAIFDVYMPGLDGLEVLRQLRSTGQKTDVILVTAAHDAETIQQGIQYGAVDYIIKPFTFQRFKKSLANYQRYINKMSASDKLSQKDVDMLKAGSIVAPDEAESIEESELPKGLQQTTLDIVVQLLNKKTGYFTVNEIAEGIGISRVTARRYLNYLYTQGKLKTVLSYGPVGRPLHKFIVYKENG